MSEGSPSGYRRVLGRVYDAMHGVGALGLTHAQRLSAAMIVSSVVVAILATEVEVRRATGLLLPTIEALLVGAFTFEYVLRVWSAGTDPRYGGLVGRVRYALSPFALLDLLAILPFLAGLGSQSFLLRLVRLVRLLALSRLLRYSAAMRTVLMSIHSRRFELACALGIAGTVILLSAGALYTVEAEAQPEAFGSIPRSIWWSITTLTTVGYGDVVPVTPWGKFFASVTALAGVGLIAMPTGILAAAFSDAFQRSQRDAADAAPGDPTDGPHDLPAHDQSVQPMPGM